jgi:hypothetical protein
MSFTSFPQVRGAKILPGFLAQPGLEKGYAPVPDIAGRLIVCLWSIMVSAQGNLPNKLLNPARKCPA